jgi:hypothetical protein
MGLLGHRERLDQRVLDGLVLSDVPLADGVCDALEARVAVRQATQTLPCDGEILIGAISRNDGEHGGSTRIRHVPLRFAADKAAVLGERSEDAGAG